MKIEIQKIPIGEKLMYRGEAVVVGQIIELATIQANNLINHKIAVKVATKTTRKGGVDNGN